MWIHWAGLSVRRHNWAKTMLPPLKIFQVDQDGVIAVLTPVGDATAFRYQDLHLEANTIRGLIGRGKIQHLVIDLSQLNYFGSEFIGSLVSMARETRTRRGSACMCAASEQMVEVLQNMSLAKLWPYFPTREEALDHVRAK